MTDERWFERLAEIDRAPSGARAPARLKAKVYSAVLSGMAQSGPLEDLLRTKEAGGHLCVFENVLTLLPIGSELRSKNPCRVCHARVLGERLNHAPIFWPGCPYSDFHNG
jgi:hypothetical protein